MDKKKTPDPCFKKVPVPGRKVYEIPEEVEAIIERAKELPPEMYEVLCLELMKINKLSKPQIVKVKNLLIAEEKRARRSERSGESGEMTIHFGSGQPSTVDPWPLPSPQLPLPASKVPLIVRSDLAAVAETLALDTEKIIDNQHKPLSGDVAVVDLKGRLVFWAYINRPRETVCRLNTSQTGLTTEKLEMGMPIDLVHTTLLMILKDKNIAGIKLIDDFSHLGLTMKDLTSANVTLTELQDFFLGEKNQPIKLSQLAIHFLGSDPQEGTHSSLRDARITAICFKRMVAFKAAGMSKFKCEEFDKF